MTLLEATFLVQTLPVWSANLSKRLVKSPKLLLSDTGLAVQLLGMSEIESDRDRMLFGALLENFVAMELNPRCGRRRRFP